MGKWRWLVFLIVAGVVWYWRWKNGQMPFVEGERIRITTRLHQQPMVKADKWTGEEYGWMWLSVGSEQIGMRWDLEKELNYGDQVRIEGMLKLLSEQSENKWSKIWGVNTWVLSNPEVKIIDSQTDMSWWGKMDRGMWGLRQKLLDIYRGVLPRNETGLLIGMVLGIKGELSDGFSIHLRNIGMIHVVVASGYNVMLLAGLLSGVLIVWWRRQVAVLIAVGIIWFYVWLAGGEAPVVRAGLMGSLAYLGIALGRAREAGWLLVVSGVVMLWWRPMWLWDVGWQLSVAATAGLIWIEPILKLKVKSLPAQAGQKSKVQIKSSKVDIVDRVRDKLFAMFDIPVVGESLRATLAAQVAVFPIIMTQFGQWSWWSVVTNVALLWMVPVLTIAGMVAGAVGLFFKPLVGGIMWLIWPLLKLFVEVVEFMGSKGVMQWQMPGWVGVIYYGVLIWLVRNRIKNMRRLEN